MAKIRSKKVRDMLNQNSPEDNCWIPKPEKFIPLVHVSMKENLLLDRWTERVNKFWGRSNKEKG